MALTWGDLREQIRVGLLRDAVPDEETNAYRWADEELLTYCWWALAQFAKHTAVATGVTFTPATGLEYNLPDNILSFEKLDVIGQVYLLGADNSVEYLDPIRYTPGVSYVTGKGFYTWPDTVLRLNLTSAPGSEYSVVVNYFAHYDRPYAENDVVGIPRWAEPAFAYLIASHALSGASMKSASIRQFNDKRDSGTPEHNPLRDQQKWFLSMYECEIAKYPPQDRTNWHRSKDW